MVGRPPNDEIADLLDRIADLLAAQDGGPYRLRAYRNAAAVVRGLDRPVAEILRDEGRKGLEALPAVGRSIAATIEGYVGRGRVPLLDRLEGEASPESLFTTVPGVGAELAQRIHETLHVETLEELEAAAHDGRLAGVEGFGVRRVQGIREALDSILRHAGRRRARQAGLRRDRITGGPPDAPAPPVDALLAIDAGYRERAAAGRLRKIAPRRFNPEGEAWLPIWHTRRGGWAYTALYSNTPLAHRLGRTRDWVVLHYERDGREGQCTVVTETRGPHAGRRVVRGRETAASEVAPPS